MLTLSAGVAALIGGGLMVVSGFTVHSLLLSLLGIAGKEVVSFLPADIALVASIIITVLTLLIALGGITVILGGVLLFYRRTFTGRLLIALGGGASFLGLMMAVFYSYITLGPSSLVTHSQYWLGVVLAVVARWIAGRA